MILYHEEKIILIFKNYMKLLNVRKEIKSSFKKKKEKIVSLS